MKNSIPAFILLLVLSGCGGMANMKQQLQDAMVIQKIFNVGNCNISSTVSTDGNSFTLKLTNAGESKYSELSSERYFSCVAYEFAHLKTDSVLKEIGVLTIEIGTESKGGFVTTSSSNTERYTYSELKRMDSLFRICSSYLELAFSEGSYKISGPFWDTLSVKDSAFVIMDSLFAPVFPFGIDSIAFFGYETRAEKGIDAVSLQVMNKEYTNVLRFIFKEDSDLSIQMDVNPVTE